MRDLPRGELKLFTAIHKIKNLFKNATKLIMHYIPKLSPKIRYATSKLGFNM